MDLVMVTASYPFDSAMEQTFMEPELEVLRKRFARIVIVPQSLAGRRLKTPGNPEVRTDYAVSVATRSAKLRHARAALSLGLLGNEIRERPLLLVDRRAVARLGGFLIRAAAMERWAYRFVAENPSSEYGAVYYTWWADAGTMGLGLARRRHPGLVLVSRAHSADLYPDRLKPPYLPCRAALYRSLDRLYPDSERGAQYVREQFKWFKDQCITARQGVDDPGFRTSPSSDGVFRVMSCSLIIPRKRVALLALGLAQAANRRPGRRIEWTHIGDGPLRNDLERQVAAMGCPNFSARILGMLGPSQMLEVYRTQPIDLFANVSEMEGTPVSLMEAISCAVPILATAVGGNTEVVSEDVGVLLTENPDPSDIADAIIQLMDDPKRRARYREGARKLWEARYDSTANYELFVDELAAIREARSLQSL